MAANESTPIFTTTQVATNPNGPPTVIEPTPATPPAPRQGEALYPPQGPAPAGTLPEALSHMADHSSNDSRQGVGVDGEEVVWEARYSMRNFLGRLTTRSLALIAWIALAVYTWGYSDGSLAIFTGICGAVVALLWLALVYRILLARFGHYYRLTTRRLFVSTGLMRRRRDMMELLRVKDVFTRQGLFERWLALGTVVVVSSDKELPTFYLTGVDDPKRVMDLIWHQARSERDRLSTKIDSV